MKQDDIDIEQGLRDAIAASEKAAFEQSINSKLYDYAVDPDSPLAVNYKIAKPIMEKVSDNVFIDSKDSPQYKYEVLDSGQRDKFNTGAQRDTQTDKPRFDLIPSVSLRRLANLYSAGAKKYGEHNFEKGIPYSRVYASLFRHLIQWAEGEQTEDHLASVMWNAAALIYYDEMIKQGRLPKELNDMSWSQPTCIDANYDIKS